MTLKFTTEQQAILDLPENHKTFLFGLSMRGKTTAGCYRLSKMLADGMDANNILILTPQRTLAESYYQVVNDPNLPSGGQVDVLTFGGLAQRLVSLFWPMFAGQAGFLNPQIRPSFLTLESAQYYLAQVVEPLFSDGYFENVNLDRNRILSQILDNLNKCAFTCIPYQSISSRLKSAWVGKPSQLSVYEQAQVCANLFRAFCYEHNLLDFSLQIEMFSQYLRTSPVVNQYMLQKYRHLIYDNIEEDTYIAQDTVLNWLPDLDSALLIYDQNSGYRSFLGADPQYGLTLKDQCDQKFEFNHELVISKDLVYLSDCLEKTILHQINKETLFENIQPAFRMLNYHYSPEMVEGVTSTINDLVQAGTPPAEIAVMAPFLSDTLRFSLFNSLEKKNIAVRTHRPSRSLRQEPAVQCLITWAKMAYPSLGFYVSPSDLRFALMQSIQDIDLVRAGLLARITFKDNKQAGEMTSFERINPDMQERITHLYGSAFERIRLWINQFREAPSGDLDIFFSRFFGELLSQPGFGFHKNYDAAASASLLIESTQKFRRDTWSINDNLQNPVKAYLMLVDEGLVGAQYVQNWQQQTEDAVFISPAYTFLMVNRPVSVQFWLDTGSIGWWERLLQPLTHPYVLSRYWPEESPWTDAMEYSNNQLNMARMVQGLIRRCRQQIFFVSTACNEQGDEQKGPLIQALQSLLRHTQGGMN